MKNLSKEAKVLDIWEWGADLPIKNYAHQCVATKDKLYMIGGVSGSSILNTVYHAPISEDGSLGDWVQDTSLLIGSSFHQCVVIKDRLYVLGGHSDSGALSTVYYAPILEDGSLGDWVRGEDAPTSNHAHQCVVVRDRLYLIGGYNGSSGALNTVYYAPILEDGSLGDWVQDTNLPISSYAHQCVVVKNRLYMLGGVKGSTLNKVYYTPILEDGGLGNWVEDNNPPISSYAHQCVATKDKLYMIGGVSGSSILNTVYHAPISEDGNLGDWVEDVNLPIKNYGHQCVVIRDRLCVVGGYNSVYGYLNTVYYASI